MFFFQNLRDHLTYDFGNSVIALPGLGTHAFGTFRERGSNFMWLRDRLPKDIPGSRVFIWDYDTALLDSISVQSIADLGIHFREALRWVSSNGVMVSVSS